MKLKKRLKGVADLKRGGMRLPNTVRSQMAPHQREAWDKVEASYNTRENKMAQAAISPTLAHAVGMSYTGPNMPDKGKKNGSCNVTACQMPLAGKVQYFMDGRPWSHTEERKYYCKKCEIGMTKWDHIDRPGQPLRCTPDEDNDKLPDSERYW